jgi:hypothetical protein
MKRIIKQVTGQKRLVVVLLPLCMRRIAIPRRRYIINPSRLFERIAGTQAQGRFYGHERPLCMSAKKGAARSWAASWTADINVMATPKTPIAATSKGLAVAAVVCAVAERPGPSAASMAATEARWVVAGERKKRDRGSGNEQASVRAKARRRPRKQ